MKKILIGVVIALASVLVYKSCSKDSERRAILEENSMLIQKQLKNVSKLIVTEGHFAEVYTYKDSKEILGTLFTADKKALVVVNAEVSIVYDLSHIDYTIDSAQKTLRIENIPKPEIKIHPDFEYYDVSADYFNPFKAGDYNKIKKNVKTSLLKKVKSSSMVSNAENRLLSELSHFYVITDSMGWTLVYNGEKVDSTKELFNMGKTVVD